MSARELAWRATSVAALPLRDARRRARQEPQWHAPWWSELLHRLVETARESLIADAERIAGGELRFWGHRVFAPQGVPRWDVDPLSGLPHRPSRGRAFANDAKPILELNRQQHLFPLAAGATAAKREDWARLCIRQLLDSTVQRERSGYEAAHRLVGWAWTIPLLLEHMTREELDALSRSFTAQCAFVKARPSRYSSANNHRLAELTGLLAGALLRTDRLSWDRLWAELETETLKQTYGDGGSREQAAGYFLYVLEILWVAGLFSLARGRGLGRLRRRLETMLEWLDAVADSHGEPPPVGDDAEDRMIRVDYFEPRRARAIAGRVRSLLDAEPSLARRSEPPSTQRSVLLAESGYAVFRGPDTRLVVDVGALGYGPLAAHGHADALSVLLDVGGEPVLRDSGTGAYAPPDVREPYRSSAAHNTVLVEGRSQAQPLGPHLWGRRYRTTVEAAHLSEELDYVRASHDGYAGLPCRAIHTRSVAYMKLGLLVVLDRVASAAPCEATLVWQLGEDLQPDLLAVQSVPTASHIEDMGPHSTRYSWHGLAPRLTWSACGTDVTFASLIALAGAAPVGTLRRDKEAAIVEIEEGNRLRIVERWSGGVPTIER